MYFCTKSSFCCSSSTADGSPNLSMSIVAFGLKMTLFLRLTWRSNALEVSVGEYCDNFLQWQRQMKKVAKMYITLVHLRGSQAVELFEMLFED